MDTCMAEYIKWKYSRNEKLGRWQMAGKKIYL